MECFCEVGRGKLSAGIAWASSPRAHWAQTWFKGRVTPGTLLGPAQKALKKWPLIYHSTYLPLPQRVWSSETVTCLQCRGREELSRPGLQRKQGH